MRKLLGIGVLAAFGAALAGCNPPNLSGAQDVISVAATDLAAIVSHSGQACADVQVLTGALGAPLVQVAAANPNNAQLQQLAANGGSVAGWANASCQTLAATLAAPAKGVMLEIPLSAYKRLH